ncbi:MAG TPA: DMT family transporter [Gemmatimonadota bacterium]|nr:DMT family transporter [Gemmatimonadota bacterium]
MAARLPRFAALLGIAALIAIFASAFVGIRFAVREYPPGALALLRFGVASVLLAGVLLARRRRLPRPALRDAPGLAASGLFGVTLYHLALNAGERTVTAAVASLFVNTTPIFAALLATALLRERPRPRVAAGIAIGFAGVTLVSLGETGVLAFDRGAALVLAAALASAVYYVIEKPYLSRYPALEVTAWGFWSGTLLLLPFGGQLAGAIREAPPTATLAVLYLGAFPAAIGYVGWSMVLARMEVARATTLLYLIPPVAALLGWGLLGEALGPAAALGGAVTIAGVALVNARRKETSSARRAAFDRHGRREGVDWDRSRERSVIPGSRHDPTPPSRRRPPRRLHVVLRGRRGRAPAEAARGVPGAARGRAGR